MMLGCLKNELRGPFTISVRARASGHPEPRMKKPGPPLARGRTERVQTTRAAERWLMSTFARYRRYSGPACGRPEHMALTRRSIKSGHVRKVRMDCRVKPGNDE